MMNEIPAGVVQKVRQILNNDIRFVAVFREMAERDQARKRIDLYRLKLSMNRGGISFSDLEIHQLFEKLQNAGVGKLTVAPNHADGHSTFEWKYTMQTLAKTVLAGLRTGDAGVLARVPADSPKNSIVTVYELNGVPVPITLPRSFGTKDAEKLGAYLLTVARMNENGNL